MLFYRLAAQKRGTGFLNRFDRAIYASLLSRRVGMLCVKAVLSRHGVDAPQNSPNGNLS